MSKFGFKLDEEGKRAAIAAMRSRRWASPVVADVFTVSKRTAENLCSPDSGMYRAVFAEMDAMGVPAFIEKHLTPELVKSLDEAAATRVRMLERQRLERAKQRAEDQLKALAG